MSSCWSNADERTGQLIKSGFVTDFLWFSHPLGRSGPSPLHPACLRRAGTAFLLRCLHITKHNGAPVQAVWAFLSYTWQCAYLHTLLGWKDQINTFCRTLAGNLLLQGLRALFEQLQQGTGSFGYRFPLKSSEYCYLCRTLLSDLYPRAKWSSLSCFM